jgi:hypothetical protein
VMINGYGVPIARTSAKSRRWSSLRFTRRPASAWRAREKRPPTPGGCAC